ncbi:MAG: peptide chain release factor N(5)-glutamine methyltransferase [Dehalococcoidia bacterium]|nr:peptide chain release factor N(5)-glutamine methyltransferase [Dehalococcoidia bacterium]
MQGGEKLSQLLRWGRTRLARLGLEEAPLEAEVLLMDALNVSRDYLFTHGDEPVGAKATREYCAHLERRGRREPLAYITGHKEFFGLCFHVDRRVLIPRPETELLVEECLRLLQLSGAHTPVLADVGTGSGAIAVALAASRSEVMVYATDNSQEALQVASFNAARQSVQERITFLQGSLLAPLPEPVDMVLANLPYVPTDILATLQPEIADYEPLAALDGGRDGLAVIRGLLSQAPTRLRPGGRVLLEIGADQAVGVMQAASERMPGAGVRVVKDLAGLDRVVVIELAA